VAIATVSGEGGSGYARAVEIAVGAIEGASAKNNS
jgi:hypothetical protein